MRQDSPLSGFVPADSSEESSLATPPTHIPRWWRYCLRNIIPRDIVPLAEQRLQPLKPARLDDYFLHLPSADAQSTLLQQEAELVTVYEV